MPRGKSKTKATTANLGFEAKLWAAADALRNNMDAAEYKRVLLGLIVLKYISDDFEAKHAGIAEHEIQGADPENRVEYRSKDTVFRDLVSMSNPNQKVEVGEHWTPRDSAWLLANLMFLPVADRIKFGGHMLYIYTCGLGNLPAAAEGLIESDLTPSLLAA